MINLPMGGIYYHHYIWILPSRMPPELLVALADVDSAVLNLVFNSRQPVLQFSCRLLQPNLYRNLRDCVISGSQLRGFVV
jgi:hypothetical protein